MAKSKTIEEKPKKPNPAIDQRITETLEKNFMPYAMSVIVSRAIPQIDGFKPAHRKLLYTMYKMGLLTGGRVKSADIVGQTMRLNPHGEGAIYETLVRLARGNETLLHPFVDSKGNFGKQYSRDMAYAASRYTEAKLDPICAEIFKDIDKEAVELVDNYNNTMKEPALLPTTFPNLLVTPNLGIAVGMASSVCSFNLKEVCDATIAYIKDENCDLMKYLKAPDFASGGELLFNEETMRQIYETGRGSFKLRSVWSYDKKNSCIEITQIPYTSTSEAIIDKIVSLVKTNKVKDITDVRDETGLNGLKITVDIRKSADPAMIMNRLFQLTPLQESFSCNFNILVNGKPKVMGIREILEEWLLFRVECVTNRVKFDLRRNNEKLHLLIGLAEILLDIDKAVRIIRETEEDRLVIPNLMNGFSIDKPQAEFIAEIKLRNLNKEYLLNRVAERENLEAEIGRLRELLDDHKKMLALIASELKEVSKKYGKPRMTEIVVEEHVEKLPDEAFIDDYACKLFLTEHSYFKKISLVSLRSSGEQNTKDDDKIIQEIETTNKAEVLFFTDRQNCYKVKAHELPDQKASAIGDYLPNILTMPAADNERVVFMAVTNDYSGFLIFAFENGKVAKIPLNCYWTKTNRKKLINAVSDKSPLCFAAHIMDDRDLIAFRGTEKALLFSTSLIAPVSSKNSGGVQVFTLKKNSKVTSVLYPEKYEAKDIEHYRSAKIPSTGHFIIDDQLEL